MLDVLQKMKCIIKETLVLRCIRESTDRNTYWICCEVQGEVLHLNIPPLRACYGGEVEEGIGNPSWRVMGLGIL